MNTNKRQGRSIVSIVVWALLLFFFRPGFVEGASVVRTDKNIYSRGEAVRVDFTNSPGSDRDWICIVPAGSPDTDAGDYQYMPRGVIRGYLMFNPPLPGKYEARAYYNYRRNGYVVTGRHAFSVLSDIAHPTPPMERVEQDLDSASPSGAELPPPIDFDEPPNVVVLPETDIYAVPYVGAEIYFQGGWWWRPWGGYWYRSPYYNHGWTYYHGSPPWYGRVPPNWRHGYYNHMWGGQPWYPPHISHGDLNRHWQGGYWRSDPGVGHSGRPSPYGGGGYGGPSGGARPGGGSGGARPGGGSGGGYRGR